MSITNVKSILVALTEEGREDSAPSLGYALSLASQSDAHLSVLAASMKVEVVQANVSRTISYLVAVEQHRRSSKALQISDDIARVAKAANVECTVEHPLTNYNELRRSFAAKARVHDLVVLDAEASATDPDRGLIHAAIYSTGRPVIIVPEGHNTFRLSKCVLAWDGSAAAARAINDALPLLRAAETVELLSVGEEPIGEHFQAQLKRHGIRADVKTLAQKGSSIAGTIQSEAARIGADLLVMGAYGHSRFKEFLLGGVSRSFLTRSEVPLFLSH